MNLNLPHLHLLLNHVPTVGTVIALGLLATALVRKSDALARAALELFYGVALLTLPAYVTGLATAQVLTEVPEVSAEAVARHHDAALIGSFLMLFTGGLAWLALWQSRQGGRKSGTTWSVLVVAALTLATMGGAASLGGEIRHPEIIVGEATTGDIGPAWLRAASIQSAVTDNVWLWPGLEALHFVGLAVLFGVVVVVNARLLGLMPGVSYAAVHRLIPWAALALGVNAVSGMLFMIATPQQYADNISFHAKLVLLILAGANLLYLTESEEPFRVGPNQRVPAMAKTMAVSAILLWIGVMYFGRMLPFIGGAF
ncbi:MAG TPA: DUF6644 family protein [Vicinamibacterales bacterium]